MEHQAGSHYRMPFPDGLNHFDSPCFNERLMYLPFLLAKVILSFDFSHTIKHFHFHACFFPVFTEQAKTMSLLKKVAELEQLVGQKQVEVEYLKKVIDFGSEITETDIKKKFESRS